MADKKAVQLTLNDLRDFEERFSSNESFSKQQTITLANGNNVIFHFLIRCDRRNGKQISFARVRVTEGDGVTPLKPNSLYMWVTARTSLLTRNIAVSELQATIVDDIEEGTVGYTVNVEAKSYGPDSEATDSLDDCARP